MADKILWVVADQNRFDAIIAEWTKDPKYHFDKNTNMITNLKDRDFCLKIIIYDKDFYLKIKGYYFNVFFDEKIISEEDDAEVRARLSIASENKNLKWYEEAYRKEIRRREYLESLLHWLISKQPKDDVHSKIALQISSNFRESVLSESRLEYLDRFERDNIGNIEDWKF